MNITNREEMTAEINTVIAKLRHIASMMERCRMSPYNDTLPAAVSRLNKDADEILDILRKRLD